MFVSLANVTTIVKMTHSYYILLAIFLLFVGQVSNAQTTDSTKILSLHDCMVFALSNSTRLRIQQATSDDVRIARRDAILMAFTPTIEAQTYAYYNFGRSIDPQTNTYFTQTSFHNNYSINAGFTLFNGFEAVNNLKISKTGLAISKSKEKQTEADICLAIMEAYYNTVYYSQLVIACAEQVANAESQLHLGQRQAELGQKSHAVVVQLEVDLADRQYDLINMQNQYHDQLMTLSDLMFWPIDEPLNIDTTLPSLKFEALNVQSVVDYALTNNVGIKIAEYERDNAMRELNTARWQLLPTLGLYVGWSTSYYSYHGAQSEPFQSQIKNNGGEYVEMSLSIPIYNRLQKHSNISRKRNALSKTSAELEQKRRDLESEIKRAIQDFNGAVIAYYQAQRKAEVQREAYTLNARKMEQGLISPIEFQTVNNNYLKCKADEMNSLFKLLIKQSVVKYYGGVEYVEQ